MKESSSKLRLLKNRIEAKGGCALPKAAPTSTSNSDNSSSGVTHIAVESKSICIIPLEEKESSAAGHMQAQFCIPVGSNVQWICSTCNNECLAITRESRCICGHRRKEHQNNPSGSKHKLPCDAKSCPCTHFFYIVGEGSWILRCRCKHKHIEHYSDKEPYGCKKCKRCTVFDSPWVCNCGHRWNQHIQQVVIAPSDRVTFRLNHAVRRDGLP
jgi:hypothetical protein